MKADAYTQVQETVQFISKKIQKKFGDKSFKPQIGFVMGSGLGAFADQVENSDSLPFSEIPHFPSASVQGHAGRLVWGTMNKGKTPVIVFQGRLHYYEGHSFESVVLPIRVLAALGVSTVILTNAAGGLNPSFREGDIMIVTDHINMMGHNPLRGPNLKEFGPRFPDMTYAYDKELNDSLKQAAKTLSIPVREGIYIAVNGPCYETPAEVRMLRQLGADAVGMSTVPEVIVARHAGLRVATISCISNLAAGMTPHKLNHEDVVSIANKTVSKIFQIMTETVRGFNSK